MIFSELRDRSRIFVILDNKCKVKNAHKIFRWKHSLITTYDNSENWLLDYVLLKNIYTFHCKILCLSDV